jgi:hypothetical protein
MTFKEAIDFYKTNRAISEALGVSDSRVSQIKAEGGFSYTTQCVLEKHSGGVLIARREDAPGTCKSAA